MHDKKAEWIWGVLAELEAAGLIVLADKGYQGSTYAKLPYRGRNKPESQKMANRAHAKLRSPGERANAQLKTWHILRKLRCCPWRAGQLAKAIHVLQVREAKAAQCAIFSGEPMRADQPTQHCRRLHTVIGGVPPPSTKPLTTLQPSPTGDWARN